MNDSTTNRRQSETDRLLKCLYQLKIERTTQQDPHPGLRIATHHFIDPLPFINDIDQLTLATMDLLIKYAYPSLSGYGKFTISFTMKRSHGEEISFTIGPAIPLTYDDCKLIPKSEVYSHISRSLLKYAEIYDGDNIEKLMIRVYMDGEKKAGMPVSSEERDSTLASIMKAGLSDVEPITAREIRNRKRSYPSHIKAVKPSRTERKAFLVADTETILIDNIQQPYAAGLLLVRPDQKINKNLIIETYFSEDYSIILDSFEERSTKVLYDLVLRISAIVRQEKSSLTVYFHNFSRFDGIFLLKHLACHHKKYKLKPLMRNHMLYQIAVYSGKKLLFCFRDSLLLLPGKLQTLAMNLCPGLGSKGSIPYDEVNLSNLVSMKNSLLDYMKQDILLLGGVMQKAQEIIWNLFQVDIESKITISSLALTIFRVKYYDEEKNPIHIPNKNEDTFIRKAYYGGHTDTYKPYGEDLYYYDVNSLYPFVMKEFPMPGGKPVWHGNLVDRELDDSVYGFIYAYVSCPDNINKPFLPYRDKNDTLLFPTGDFDGVYYSEELKLAKELGYRVNPIYGYLFEKRESPFRQFISSLYESRLEARKDGNEALAYVYKILMNSLYGRFGINPKSTITEICDDHRLKGLIRSSDFISSDMLSENTHIVTYHSNTSPDYWKPQQNSAVQLSAAITACSRIYMSPFISRDDSYYTDTDSVVLSNPLPDEMISSTELGKFKLEARIDKGYWLAPKSYCFITTDGEEVIKFKGAGKSLVNREWFELQYANPSRRERALQSTNFRIDWSSLKILKKEFVISLGLKIGSKRKPVYRNDLWVDTVPIEVTDLTFINNIGKQILLLLRKEQKELLNENNILKKKFDQLLKREKE